MNEHVEDVVRVPAHAGVTAGTSFESFFEEQSHYGLAQRGRTRRSALTSSSI
jgi:hypothetical protein